MAGRGLEAVTRREVSASLRLASSRLGDQLGELAPVLGSAGEQELGLGAIGTSQAQPVELEDAFEVLGTPLCNQNRVTEVTSCIGLDGGGGAFHSHVLRVP